jgi:DNA-binding transcriptional ArsR family regulator
MSRPRHDGHQRDVLAKFFRGLGDPSRLSILLRLRKGPHCVSDVVEATGLSQPNASMHLACLWECGLVEREPNGRSVYYRLASDRVTPLLEMAEALLAANGDRIECCPRYRTGRSESPPRKAALAREATPRPDGLRAARPSRRRSPSVGSR